MTERRADDATRDVTNWLKCFYMQDKIGEVFEGTVAGVTSFGLFVALDGVYVEGLLHVTELGNDYFHHDKARHEMAGERTGVRYQLGDRLTVKVARVDLETTKIDFSLVNKNKSLDESIKVDSTTEIVNKKSRGGEQRPVKSSTQFGDKFGAKPASKTGGKLTLGVKPKSKSSSKVVSKTVGKNPPKPTKSKKSSKKANQR
jgi:ribonuclease R